MTRDEFMESYWAYYLMLENRFINTLTYVELSEDNFNTFSDEYASLIQIMGAELDSFFKIFCGFSLDDNKDRKNIGDYANYIFENAPFIKKMEIRVSRLHTSIMPFERWDKDCAKQSLTWWEAFDRIKHGRAENRQAASQRNVLHMLSGLFMLETIFLSQIVRESGEPDVPNESSKLFILKGWKTKYIGTGDSMLELVE